MPYAVFEQLPVLSMLRKSDRAFLMVQFVVPLALAGAWARIAPRSRRGAARLVRCAAVLMLELDGRAARTLRAAASPYLAELAPRRAVAGGDGPAAARTHVANGRFDYLQTLHDKKTTLGYTTALAVTPFHDQRVERLVNWYWQFLFERGRTLVRQARELGVQRIVHYKTYPLGASASGSTARPVGSRSGSCARRWCACASWASSAAGAAEPRSPRSCGASCPSSSRRSRATRRITLHRRRAPGVHARLGPPVHEDDDVLVFAVPEER
jgi:hypothetical protein